MTEIKATLTDKHFRLEANYHSADKVTCAAISALICTLAGAAQINKEAVDAYTKLEPGHAIIQYVAKGETAEEDMRLILLGLMQIEAQYPGSVHVEQNIFS